MTQEERILLHIDLSERIPYDLVLKVKGLVTSNEEFGDAYLDTVSWYEEVSVRDGSRVSYDIANVRPYLRPLSSMTDEEKEELKTLCDEDLNEFAGHIMKGHGLSHDGLYMFDKLRQLDWLIKKMFDFRELIQKGLAIEAPKGMYNS